MPRRSCWLALVLWVAIAAALPGAVRRIQVAERSEVLGGRPFGRAGAYERIAGRVEFAVDPKIAANQIICDIGLAPVDAEGRVAFSADLFVLRPRDAAKGNGIALFEVLNRGNKGMVRLFNLAKGSNDPRSAEEFGDGFLLERGYTLVWLGWQADVPLEAGRMRLRTPIARNLDGSPVTGLVRADFVPPVRETVHSLGDRNHIPYAVLDPTDNVVRLTVRDRADAPRRVIPRDRWRFSDDGTAVAMESGFEPGQIYEVVYRAKDPPLVGLGPAAIRDLISFLKYARHDGGAAAGLEGRTKLALGFGISQSGRFLRTFLYYGFNRDEQGRKVFDGVWAHVAGGGRGSFNHRFAQPSRDAHPHMNFFYPTDIFPFTDASQEDPSTGRKGGLLERARRHGVVPRIFYTNGSYEYWGRAASLIHTTLDGRADVPPAPGTRIYLLAGTQHGTAEFPPSRQGVRYFSNPADYRWPMRALLAAFERWLTQDVEPPPSRYPRISDGTLVPLEKVRFPAIPGVRFPDRIHRAWRADYGPDFYSAGVVTKEPPAIGEAYGVLVPQTDADGNELAGIRLAVARAALGTFTGWNYRAAEIGAPGELADMIGGYFPFPRTEAERAASGDPRAAVMERYGGRDDYLAKVRAAAEALVQEGFGLPGDVERMVEEGARQWEFVLSEGSR